jgi:hypothetical protein
MSPTIAPARPSQRFRRVFAWYTRRLVSKRFATVRFDPDSIRTLEQHNLHDGPVVLAMNHASWWDPLLGLLIAERYFADRASAAPMAIEQWNTFKFMRKLGIFGVDTNQPDAMQRMAEHVGALFDREPRSLLAITPQGEFADVRLPVRIRPGTSAIAAARPDAKLIALAIEYTFWTDQRPEVFVRARTVERPDSISTAAWHRAITRSMRANAASLAASVIARDASRFTEPFAQHGAGVNRIYDAVAKLRGRSTRIPTEPSVAGTENNRGSP